MNIYTPYYRPPILLPFQNSKIYQQNAKSQKMYIPANNCHLKVYITQCDCAGCPHA